MICCSTDNFSRLPGHYLVSDPLGHHNSRMEITRVRTKVVFQLGSCCMKTAIPARENCASERKTIKLRPSRTQNASMINVVQLLPFTPFITCRCIIDDKCLHLQQPNPDHFFRLSNRAWRSSSTGSPPLPPPTACAILPSATAGFPIVVGVSPSYQTY